MDMTYPRRLAAALGLILLVSTGSLAQPREDEDCMACHEDRALTKMVNGRQVSLYVNYSRYARSVHAAQGCASCHADIDVDDLPHPDKLEPVDCSMCHDRAVDDFWGSLHGAAVREGRTLAPTCEACHGKHEILPSSSAEARTFVMNIPSLCGECHKEGTSVSELRSIAPDRRHVLEDYSESIHGAGLLERGLIVTAVCTSCHNSHSILPHEDRRSSIHRNNIPTTCMQCHRRIEDVHLRVVDGQLWEKRPHELPVCVDCHMPHQLRRVIYDRSMPDEYCMSCHSDRTLARSRGGVTQSLFVDGGHLAQSIHNTVTCVGCHTRFDFRKDPVCLDSGPVDCAMCHTAQVDEYNMSKHGTDRALGKKESPYCSDCHGTHDTRSRLDPTSTTFALRIPELCANCHGEGQAAEVSYTGTQQEIVKNYSMSIHGKGLLQSGLVTTATCASCHTPHRELPSSDPASSVHPDNVSATCGTCHLGIYEKLRLSVHSPDVTKTNEKLPVCNDCHLSHTINRVDVDDFRQGIMDQCGTCHEEVTTSYFDTFHGKVSKLGSLRTAKCYDCHGSHEILPPSNPASLLSRENVVATCAQCHPDSNPRFAGYLTHATHTDREAYPGLYYTFWFMTALLVSVFAFFGLHTLMWFPRALRDRLKRRTERNQENESTNQ